MAARERQAEAITCLQDSLAIYQALSHRPGHAQRFDPLLSSLAQRRSLRD